MEQDEKWVAQKLIEISREEKAYRQKYMREEGPLAGINFIGNGDGAVNTSQKGDWDNFRNERIDLLDGEGWREFDFDARRPPDAGMLDFDFVSTNTHHRMTTQTKPISWVLFKLLCLDIVHLHRSVRARDHRIEEDLPEWEDGHGPQQKKELWQNLRSAALDTMNCMGRGWHHDIGASGSSDGTRSPISRPSTREANGTPRRGLESAGSMGSLGSSDGGLEGTSRPSSREALLAIAVTQAFEASRPQSREFVSNPKSGSGSRPDSRGPAGSRPGSKASRRKKGRRRKRGGKGEEETIDLAAKSLAANHVQRIFRGWSVRCRNVYERVYEFAMLEMEANQRRRGWDRLMRDWAGVPYKELSWAASIFQKCWRGRCARLVVRRSKMKEMERELASSGAAGAVKRWATVTRRPCWYSPHQHHRVVCDTWAEAEKLKQERIHHMLRRCTLNHYFSAQQVDTLLRMVPPSARLNGLIALWSAVIDLENLHIENLLHDDPERLQPRTEQWVAQFYNKIGPANAFNPYLPDGYYCLNLRNADERAVAACLVELGVTEPGENFRDETYNGIPFEVGQKWVDDGPPDVGEFATWYSTHANCARLACRIGLANRLLMPGTGRWQCIPPSQIAEEDVATADEYDINWAMGKAGMVDDDGILADLMLKPDGYVEADTNDRDRFGVSLGVSGKL